MRRSVLGLLLLLSFAGAGAQTVERAAPRERVELELAGARVAVEYGRPSRRGRAIFGSLVPWGRVWRTGIDEATKLATDRELVFGGLTVPAGSYALFTVPGEREWIVILNRAADQWGAYGHDPGLDLGRVRVAPAPLSSPVEQLTIALETTGERAGLLRLEWEAMSVAVPFEVLEPPPTPPPGAAT